MNSDTPLDCAVFELSPRRSRCELFVSGNGRTEKLASGLLKPFITHLKVAEEQAARPGNSIRLEVERSSNGSRWFNKGTLERFVRFVSTPEVLDSANAYDAEMSQLEGARRIYSQGAGDMVSGSVGEYDTTSIAAADITKYYYKSCPAYPCPVCRKELLRAIDVRLTTLKQDLATACSRAFSAGFSIDNVSELLLFAEHFGANRLIEACNKFILLCQRHSEIIGQQKLAQAIPLHLESFVKGNISSSKNPDMSINEPELELGAGKAPAGDLQHQNPYISQSSKPNTTVMSGASQPDKPILRQRAVSEKPVSSASSASASVQQDGGNARRLSVQDRINLFENKQKQQSGNSGNISTMGVNKVVAGKGHHRRLSSDVSDKSVLRRWSGASDMSIDLTSSHSDTSNDPKESGSGIGTPTSTNLLVPSRGKTEETNAPKDTVTLQCKLDLKESPNFASSSSLQSHSKRFPAAKDNSDDESVKSSTMVTPVLEKGKHYVSVSMRRAEHCGLDDPDTSKIHQETSSNTKLIESVDSSLQSKAEDHFQTEDEAVLPEISHAVSAAPEQVGWRNEEVLQSQCEEIPSRADGNGVKDQAKFVNQFQIERRRDAKVKEVKAKNSDSQVQFKVLSDLSTQNEALRTSLSQRKTVSIKVEEVSEGHDASSHAPPESSLVRTQEDTNNHGRNVQQQSSVHGASLFHIAISETSQMPTFHSRKANDRQKVVEPPSSCRIEQHQVMKTFKGTQELNDELRMKADELEKLFAAHKIRTLSEQASFSRRSKSVVLRDDHAPMAMEERHAVTPPDEFHEKRSMRETSQNEELDVKVVNSELGSRVNENLDFLCPSDDLRGKLYYKYLKKRDAKLLEEGETRRAQKDAKMKAMLDSLELSQAEMTSRYAGSGGRQGSNANPCHADKLRSLGKSKSQFAVMSSLDQDGFAMTTLEYDQRRIQKVVGSVPEEKDLEEWYVRDQVSPYDNPFGDNSFKNINSLKFLSTKTVSSSTPRIPVASLPKSSVKSAKSVSIKHKSRTGNPLAESLPNFSDFRKENAKPSTASNRVNTRDRSKILSRSKSIIEETKLVKEDNPRRSQSMRKSTAVPGELKDLSPLTSDSPDIAPKKIDRAQTDATFSQKALKSGEFKSFVRKGKVAGPALGANIGKPKASIASEKDKNGECYERMVQIGNSPELDKDAPERSFSERDDDTTGYPVDLDSEKPSRSHEYENSDDFGSEDGDFQRSLSQLDYATAPLSPKLDASAVFEQGSPAESPLWGSHLHNSFPYVHEASDIDASVDSPIGSPASWSLHPLDQMEADAARMRKKWGSAQMPMIVANASQQSRKDVTKGFKRLLKFRRKSRGVETLVTDWVSASTASEGDDDTEDSRDLSIRPTEDLRKTRMSYTLPYTGFSRDTFSEQAESLRGSIPHPPADFKLSEDHLIGSSLKAPRSFFSLSSFRSKESKPR